MQRILIYPILLVLFYLCTYLFIADRQSLTSYNLETAKVITGELDSYNREEGRAGFFFNFKLRGLKNVFDVPLPEWTSFDFESFKNEVKTGDTLQLNVPGNVGPSDNIINVFQINKSGHSFIDFDKMRSKRRNEMWLALFGAIACLAGIIHHYFRPWR